MKITVCSWGACAATDNLTLHREGSDDGSVDAWAWCPEHEAEGIRRGLCSHAPDYYSLPAPDPKQDPKQDPNRLTPEARKFLGSHLRLEF